MKKGQNGFTLIELMIVTAIIGILAAIGSGYYADYIVRAQVAEGLVLAGGLKTTMMEYYSENGHMPQNNNQAGVPNQNNIEGGFVKMVEINKHRIEVQYGNDANAAIWGKKIQLVPRITQYGISWDCVTTGGGVEDRYLPSSCN